MWLTGATGIPAAGFHKLIDVEFRTHNRVNTCALVLTLAPVDLATPDEIVQYFCERQWSIVNLWNVINISGYFFVVGVHFNQDCISAMLTHF
ncbi:hypothetical protein DPMN_107658 [Dreissena polymorpha]|uniref:Uncharacterized protein n=1 Tax=Dreissena polymorpha TaxID=45954 RepID=A0A9D4K744_DREPO|nr:hypothetical protein DPMN_107658 [Dreissena polymorpha]